MFLIAEISNMHAGDLDKAKELIRVARECGADAVKGQAFLPSDMLAHGVMPYEFYRRSAFTQAQLVELMEYARSIGTDFFCSILSPSLKDLELLQKYWKLTAKQSASLSHETLESYDIPTAFVSLNQAGPYRFQHAHLMYAQGYMGAFDWSVFGYLRRYYDRPMGVSHHNKDIASLLTVIADFDPPVVEKHFYLGEDLIFGGELYRDCLHAADPNTFTALAKVCHEMSDL